MNKDEAIYLAKSTAEEKGYPWREPVIVKKIKKYVIFGPSVWYVMSNANIRGGNINTLIDEKNKCVLKQVFVKR